MEREPVIFNSGVVTATHFAPGETAHPAHTDCRTCGKEHLVNAHLRPQGGIFRFGVGQLCPACAEAEHAADEARRADAIQHERLERWTAICPPLYQQTEIDRLPSAAQELINDWQFGPKGLLLHGPTGAGKTRAAWMLLRRLALEGRSIRAMTANEFRLGVASMFDGGGAWAARWIDTLNTVDVLFFDDLGKGRLTEAVESELFGIVESRTAHLKPIVVTLNCDAKALRGMLTEDRGVPLMRRLADFTTTIDLRADEKKQP